MPSLQTIPSLPNLYFDESGDLGFQTTNFVVGCLYVPNQNYQACLTSIEPLVRSSSLTTKSNERKACRMKSERKKKRILQTLVSQDCQLGLIHINKQTANNNALFTSSGARKDIRTKMILHLLESAIQKIQITSPLKVHIDKFCGSQAEETILSNYLVNNISYRNQLYMHYPDSINCTGIRCADHICY